GWLAALRRDTGMTQQQLAVASGRNASSRTYISEIENGDVVASRAVAHGLCVALGVPDALREQGLLHFYPPTDTTPANHDTIGSWLAAHCENADLTPPQLATAARLSYGYVQAIIH